MNLQETLNVINGIASKIQNNDLPYRYMELVKAKKRDCPAVRLMAILGKFDSERRYNTNSDKKKIKTAIRELKQIAKDYDIEDLQAPIKSLEAYLKSLG